MSEQTDALALTERIRLMGNPYAKLSFFDEVETGQPQVAPAQKHNRLKDLQNPYAFLDFYGENNLENRRVQPDIGDAFDEVLECYRPFVARSEWGKLTDYREQFLVSANQFPESKSRVIEKLLEMKFTLLPGERVEFNRAPASKIIAQLKGLLD